MSEKVNILISCHKMTDVLNTEVYHPIQVGAEGKKALPDMLHDNEGENISALNPMYCELTAQYWAWKNLDLDYYGFCHYRRYFNFSDQYYEEDIYGNIMEQYLDEGSIRDYKLDDETVKNLVDQYDVIITERKDLRKIDKRFKSSYEQYKTAEKLHIKDYKKILQIIDEHYPEYSKEAHEFAEGSVSCFCNMYILKKEIFFRYCEWMFDILDRFCKSTNMKRYSTEALRTPGHLSERLFNIFLLHLERENPELKIKEVQCVFIQDTDPQEKVFYPAFEENSVPVVFAANDRFVPIFATCLQSLINHVSPAKNYDVVLITSDITKENKQELSDMVAGCDNISLRFYNPGRLLKNYKLKANAHISVETYYRFLIQDIMKGYKKVLYLDCDLVVNADVAELYETDIDGYMLAAVRDIDFLGQINGANKNTQKYVKKEFIMKNPYNYFQAGVLLFNIEEMSKAYTLDEWLTFASTPYMYNDQDVLNLYCENRVKYLDMRWNMITDCDHYRINNVVVFAPDYAQKEYMASRKDPKIIHYAGGMKPWYRPSEDFGHVFWCIARQTPFYEELLFRLSEGIAHWQIYEATKDGKPAKSKVDTFFPRGTQRRELLDKLYVKIYK